MQRALIQYRNPKNYELVREALQLAHRTDLIGFGKECLIRPRQLKKEKEQESVRGRRKEPGRKGQSGRKVQSGRPANSGPYARRARGSN